MGEIHIITYAVHF